MAHHFISPEAWSKRQDRIAEETEKLAAKRLQALGKRIDKAKRRRPSPEEFQAMLDAQRP